jgi:putative hydrolase of the HAD superfamily
VIRAVIFDLDGTLYDERDFVKSGFEAVARHISAKYALDFEQVFHILMQDFKCGLRGKNFDSLLSKLKLPHAEVDNLVTIYREHEPKIRLYPDAEPTLKQLKGSFKLGLITDGCEETQENKIAALNIKGYFDAVIITDSLGKEHRKPSEKPFKVMLSKLGIKTTEAIYVGDNPMKDFVAAKRLGFRTVRVRRGDSEYDSIEVDDKHEANNTVPSLLYLKELLGQGTAHEE